MNARKSVQKISPYPILAVARRDKICLDLNENSCGCSPKVLEALRNIQGSDVNHYPEYDELRDKISARYDLRPENILLTNGADDGIRTVMQTFIEAGDEMLTTEPGFAITPKFAEVMGGQIRAISYKGDFAFPFSQFLSAISSNTRLISIVRPDSPTGAVIARADLIAILQKAKNLVLLDETYHHFLGETCIGLIKEFKNLVVIHSFSKAFALAGLRLGFIAADPEILQEIAKVNQPFPVNTLAVIAGLAALDDLAHIKQVVADVQAEKEFLINEFRKMDLQVRSSAANFILLKVGNEVDAVHQKLLKKKILVKNLNQQPLLKGYFRIAVGTRHENQILLKALQGALLREVLLFDMDGVLVDVSQSYRLAIKKTAEHFLDKEIHLDEIEQYKRRGGYNSDWDLTEALICANGKSVPRHDIIQVFQKYYLGNDFNGLIENERWLLNRKVLQILYERFKLGIVTGRPRVEATYVLRKFSVERYFDVLITMEDTPSGQEKPHPFGIKLALEKLSTRGAVYVGDTIDDMKAAVGAEILPLGVLPPHAKENQDLAELLSQAGAQTVLKDINDLLEVLK